MPHNRHFVKTGLSIEKNKISIIEVPFNLRNQVQKGELEQKAIFVMSPLK
jgi:hypothetical protein